MHVTTPSAFAQRVRSLWGTMTVPSIAVDDAGLESQDVASWVQGRTFAEIAQDEEQLQLRAPLFYLTDEACAYYLGAYLLRMAIALDHGRSDELEAHSALLGLIFFVGSERGIQICYTYLSECQRALLCDLCDELITYENLVRPKEVLKLFIFGITALKKLGSG